MREEKANGISGIEEAYDLYAPRSSKTPSTEEMRIWIAALWKTTHTWHSEGLKYRPFVEYISRARRTLATVLGKLEVQLLEGEETIDVQLDRVSEVTADNIEKRGE